MSPRTAIARLYFDVHAVAIKLIRGNVQHSDCILKQAYICEGSRPHISMLTTPVRTLFVGLGSESLYLACTPRNAEITSAQEETHCGPFDKHSSDAEMMFCAIQAEEITSSCD